MNFKHTFHVFVDNFSIVYKHLLYGLIVTAIGVGLMCAVLIPAMYDIMITPQYVAMHDSFGTLLADISNLETDAMHADLTTFRTAFSEFFEMFGSEKAGLLALCVALVALVIVIYRFLMGIGNYTTGVLISDKMTLQAKSPFIVTMVKNLGKASIYNLIYVPIACLYDVCTVVILWALFFKWLHVIPMLFRIFLFVTVFIALIAVKQAFTVNWLPSLIHAKQTNRKAFIINFKKSTHGFWHNFSTFVVLSLIVLVLNIAALLFSFGAGLLITIPASYVSLICYRFVAYYNSNGLKFFIGNDIIGPKKETPPTVEEFFKGEDR